MVASFWTTTPTAQELVTEPMLKGTWFITSSPIREAMTFAGDKEFVQSYVQSRKDGKEIPPVQKRSGGAYDLRPGACSVGQALGNLWVVKDSQRCCYNAYAMGKTLVLDEVKGTSVFGGCTSKTLRRESDLPSKK